MDATRHRAAITHITSAIGGLVATAIGVAWVRAAGEATAVPETVIVVSLVVLAPIAVRRSWRTRGHFVDHHVHAAARFLTGLAAAATVVIGLPGLIAWAMPAGTDGWSSLLVLPYLGAMGLPLAWTFFAVRATAIALKGLEDPYPRPAAGRQLQGSNA